MFYMLYFYLPRIAIPGPRRKAFFCRIRIFLVRELTFLKPAGHIDVYIILVLPKN